MGCVSNPPLGGVTGRVKKMVTPYRSPVKLEVQRGGTPATALGGLLVLLELLAAQRILAGLPEAASSPSQGWSDAQTMLAVLALNCLTSEPMGQAKEFS